MIEDWCGEATAQGQDFVNTVPAYYWMVLLAGSVLLLVLAWRVYRTIYWTEQEEGAQNEQA